MIPDFPPAAARGGPRPPEDLTAPSGPAWTPPPRARRAFPVLKPQTRSELVRRLSPDAAAIDAFMALSAVDQARQLDAGDAYARCVFGATVPPGREHILPLGLHKRGVATVAWL